MHPAPSVIIFTALSGLGFGLFAWLGIGMPLVSGVGAFVFFAIAYVLAVGGLLASLLHLGNPQRFLKAFSQWRSSWLSREAWLSVAALCVMGAYAIGAIFFGVRLVWLGWLGAALSLGTVFATSMIYTSIKAVPRWHHFSTPVLFLLLSVAGGALLAGQIGASIPLLLFAGAWQLLVWHWGDRQFEKQGSTIETATGLGGGSVRLFEGPHTGTSYLTREMVMQVGRKHAKNL
ncbi:MAG: dimethyl sulfoxide reductase anchor subunit family protein, partial [Paracoccaceae bacterium]